MEVVGFGGILWKIVGDGSSALLVTFCPLPMQVGYGDKNMSGEENVEEGMR